MNEYAIYNDIESAVDLIMPGSVVRVVGKDIREIAGNEYVYYTIVTDKGQHWDVMEKELTFVNVEPVK